MHDNIVITVDQTQRSRIQSDLGLRMGVAGNFMEDAAGVYCPISLTNTPENMKDYISSQQKSLLKILSMSGLNAYDPLTAPLSPDKNLSSSPRDVYSTDLARIFMAKYFVGIHALPSTGFGAEWQAAISLMKIPVILVPRGLRITRMQPCPSIVLTFSDLDSEANDLQGIFEDLQKFKVCMGIQKGIPVLVGMKKHRIYNLVEYIYNKYPEFKYVHCPQNQSLQTQVVNLDILNH